MGKPTTENANMMSNRIITVCIACYFTDNQFLHSVKTIHMQVSEEPIVATKTNLS